MVNAERLLPAVVEVPEVTSDTRKLQLETGCPEIIKDQEREVLAVTNIGRLVRDNQLR